MRILKPKINDGDEKKEQQVEFIGSDKVYVLATDYHAKKLLCKIMVGPGVSTYCWMEMKCGSEIDVSPFNSKIYSFNDIINKTVNSLFGTVYQFESFNEMVKHWNEIKYIDNIEVVFEETKK